MAESVRIPSTASVGRKRSSRRTRDRPTVIVEHLDPSSVGQRELDVIETYLGTQLDDIFRKMRR